MEPVKNILVPTDFSENAAVAYVHSRKIAQKFDARVDFVHIIPTLTYFRESFSRLGAPLDMEKDLYPKIQEERTQMLKELMEEHIPKENRGKAICRIDRKPSERIAGLAMEEGYDLIVMASKGEHETHLLRGSVTEKIIRHSEVPVLSVNADLTSKGLNRILVPTDGSRLSFAALPLALMLCQSYDARITFYNAIELYGREIGEDEEQPPELSRRENIYETIVEHLLHYLESEHMQNITVSHRKADSGGHFTIAHDGHEQTVDFSIVTEKTVSAHLGIENYAASHADLVVMATHGRSGWAHLFLGSTAEKVARYLKIPVATVRPPASGLKKESGR